jgi:hypothetical protein
VIFPANTFLSASVAGSLDLSASRDGASNGTVIRDASRVSRACGARVLARALTVDAAARL